MDVLHPQLRSHDEDGRPWPVLVWGSDTPLRTISSAPSGGGLGLRSWVLNAQVPLSYSRCDPESHVATLATSFGLHGRGVGMQTAAHVPDVRYGGDGDHDGTGVEVAATVGLRVPTWAAPGAGAGAGEVGHAGGHVVAEVERVGTINVVAFVPQRLSDAGLVNAVGTVTEAKSQALWDASVAGTGTATDAVCICCPDEGASAPFCGPRSPWGARLAQAVHTAVLAGAQAWVAS